MSDDTIVGEYSISLRDYIALEVMKRFVKYASVAMTPQEQRDLADHCYGMADAMLAAREVK